MPATQPSRTGFKRFIASRASSLCNQVIDTSAVALCAADEVIWRYLESSHNSYARLLHKGLTAGPKKDGSAISTTTADAFNELQAGLSIITNEEHEGRLVVSPSCTADADDEVQLGRLGRFLTSASVAAALGVDEGIRALSKTRVGAIIGLPQFVKHDTDACAEWNELHHELSNVADDDDEIVCTPSSSRNLSVSLRPPTTAVGVATTFIKRVVIAAPLSDSALQTLLTVSAYAPLNGEKAASQQATQEASAWNELQSHFSY